MRIVRACRWSYSKKHTTPRPNDRGVVKNNVDARIGRRPGSGNSLSTGSALVKCLVEGMVELPGHPSGFKATQVE